MSACVAGRPSPQNNQSSPKNKRHLTTTELTQKVYNLLSGSGQRIPRSVTNSKRGPPMKSSCSAAVGVVASRLPQNAHYGPPRRTFPVMRMRVVQRPMTSQTEPSMLKTKANSRLLQSSSTPPPTPTEMAAAMARINTAPSPQKLPYSRPIQSSKEVSNQNNQIFAYTRMEEAMKKPKKKSILDVQNKRKGVNKIFSRNPTKKRSESISIESSSSSAWTSESTSSRSFKLKLREGLTYEKSYASNASDKRGSHFTQLSKFWCRQTPPVNLKRLLSDMESQYPPKKKLVTSSMVMLPDSQVSSRVTRILPNPPPSPRVSSSSSPSTQLEAVTSTTPFNLTSTGAQELQHKPSVPTVSSSSVLLRSWSTVSIHPSFSNAHTHSPKSRSPTLSPSRVGQNVLNKTSGVSILSSTKTKLGEKSSSHFSGEPRLSIPGSSGTSYFKIGNLRVRKVEKTRNKKSSASKKKCSNASANKKAKTGIPSANKALSKSRDGEDSENARKAALLVDDGETAVTRALRRRIALLCKMPVSMPTILPAPYFPSRTRKSQNSGKMAQSLKQPVTKTLNYPRSASSKAPESNKSGSYETSYVIVSPAAYAQMSKKEHNAMKSKISNRPWTHLSTQPSMRSTLSQPPWQLSMQSPNAPSIRSYTLGQERPAKKPSAGPSPGQLPVGAPVVSQGRTSQRPTNFSSTRSPVRSRVFLPVYSSMRPPVTSSMNSPMTSLGSAPANLSMRSQVDAPINSPVPSPGQSPKLSTGTPPGQSVRYSNQFEASKSMPLGLTLRHSSRHPASQPSGLPTGKPTVRPTMQPTRNSTEKPSELPWECAPIQPVKTWHNCLPGLPLKWSSVPPQIYTTRRSYQSTILKTAPWMNPYIHSPPRSLRFTGLPSERISETGVAWKQADGIRRDIKPKNPYVGSSGQPTRPPVGVAKPSAHSTLSSGLMSQSPAALLGRTRKPSPFTSKRKSVFENTGTSSKRTCPQSITTLRLPTCPTRESTQSARNTPRTPQQALRDKMHSAPTPSGMKTRRSRYSSSPIRNKRVPRTPRTSALLSRSQNHTIRGANRQIKNAILATQLANRNITMIRY